MKLTNALVLTVFALGVASCNRAYVPPTTQSQALVRFYSPEAVSLFQSVGVYAIKDDACLSARKIRGLGQLDFFSGGVDKTDRGMLKVPDSEYEELSYVEVPIAAGKRFKFAMEGNYPGATCDITMSFIPKDGAQYEVLFFTEKRHCNGVVFRLKQSAQKVTRKPEPSARESEEQCHVFWN